jgi:hypothetical protein
MLRITSGYDVSDWSPSLQQIPRPTPAVCQLLGAQLVGCGARDGVQNLCSKIDLIIIAKF